MSDTDRDIKAIGIEMVDAGLPYAFVLRVLELARESEGVEDLVHLWGGAPDTVERHEVEADLHGMLEDREPSGDIVDVSSGEDGDRLLGLRSRQKAHLRRLVDERGGVSEVARRAKMPQPSLSRLLNSMSEPRAGTLNRLAEAMGVPVSALSAQADAAPPVDMIFRSPSLKRETIRSTARLEGRVRRLERHFVRASDKEAA